MRGESLALRSAVEYSRMVRMHGSVVKSRAIAMGHDAVVDVCEKANGTKETTEPVKHLWRLVYTKRTIRDYKNH